MDLKHNKIQCLSVPNLKYQNDEGFISGYASVFGIKDHHGEIVERGAFKRSLENWTEKGQFPKLLWQHDTREPIGIWKSVVEDHYGLRVEGQLLLDVQRAREVHTLLKSRAIDGLSIGYTIQESHKDQKGVRLLTNLNLLEISLVTFGANPDAQVTVVKSHTQLSPDDVKDLEATIQNATRRLRHHF